MRTSHLFQMLTVNTHFYTQPCSLQNNLQMIKRMYKSHSLYDHGARSTATTMVIFSNYCTLTWHSKNNDTSVILVTFVSSITKPNNRTVAIFYTNSNLCLRWGKGVGGISTYAYGNMTNANQILTVQPGDTWIRVEGLS